jgi:nitroreductase
MDLSVQELFTNSRTCNKFSEEIPSQKLLEEIYNITKFGPTSANCSPLRIKFVSTKKAKDKLLGCVMQGNVASVTKAPVIAIFAFDLKFHEKMDVLFAHNPGMKNFYGTNEVAAKETAFRNSTLQAAYFMVVARSKGLGLGPMSGFDVAKLDEEFFAGTSLKSNFICTMGYPDGEPEHPRLPRLEFDEACEIL